MLKRGQAQIGIKRAKVGSAPPRPLKALRGRRRRPGPHDGPSAKRSSLRRAINSAEIRVGLGPKLLKWGGQGGLRKKVIALRKKVMAPQAEQMC